MKLFIVLAIALATANAKVIGYDSGSSGGGSDNYGGGDAYGGGATEEKCYPYFEDVVTERCEAYNERVCYTQQKEKCHDEHDQMCRAVTSSKSERQCFNVTNLLCTLKEEVRFEQVSAVFTVQKCHKRTERVCDTVYETHYNQVDDYQCIDLSTTKCFNKEEVVNDKTCRTKTHFDCSEAMAAGGMSMAGGAGMAAGSHHGSHGSGDYGHGGSGNHGASGNDYSHTPYPVNPYGASKPSCKRTEETKCYNTPRTVKKQTCTPSTEKVCEKLTERVPMPVEKQVCHDEEKRICDLEQRTQPKQVKKYTYTKQCRPVPSVVCETFESKYLVPSCVPSARKVCTFMPSERCDDIPKNHCYQVTTRVEKQRCETVAVGGGGSSGGYGGSSGGGFSAGSSSGGYDEGSSYE